ncbi:SusD/RagB family nutrient-binding outer membrane lipoprotein [Negadavirga shengliensis]|uniref:SusD/RagB family nutrient-binding outer membrane lipoprotein n=1 Tax=Negadavirga shengliensis TaxID=1389218 RepID=A0ABV9T1F9_9BACT
MKNLKIKLMTWATACMVVLGACDTDKLADLNIDPNVANEMDPGFVIAYSQLQISGEQFENWRTVLIYQSTMIQHLAALATYWSGDKYLYNQEYSAALWDRAYTGYIKDLVNLIDITDPTVEGQEELVNYHAIARVLKVYSFSRLTDVYGDVPYSEAGKGFADRNFFPSYDPQEFIYKDMLAELEAAHALFDEGAANPGNQDLFYGGNINQWRKFTNSLMLRLGMRLSEVEPATAESWVRKALEGGVFESNADITYIQHTDGPEGINRNGIGEVFNWDGSNFTTDDQGLLSRTFVNWMLERNDPRLEKLSWVRNGGEPRGLPNGYNTNTIQDVDPEFTSIARRDDYSRVNPLFVLRDAPMIFHTYAETEFLKAEAIERGWYAGNAATHYAQGVHAAMKMYGLYHSSLAVSDAAIDTYLAENPYNAAEWQRVLAEQIWAATLFNEYEAYANWRRTGYPVLTPVNYPGNQSNGTIPRRLRYPIGEAANNSEAYNEVLSRQGPDQFMTRMWWDVE